MLLWEIVYSEKEFVSKLSYCTHLTTTKWNELKRLGMSIQEFIVPCLKNSNLWYTCSIKPTQYTYHLLPTTNFLSYVIDSVLYVHISVGYTIHGYVKCTYLCMLLIVLDVQFFNLVK